MTFSARHSERGAALITVLMIVAAMSVVAVGLTTTVTSATQRARALDAQAQLRLYTVAAEEVAQVRLGAMLGLIEGKATADLSGLNEVQSIPIDGGLIQVRVTDATNCFDLNSLILENERGDVQAVPELVTEYITILESTGFSRSDAGALASALVDWMDSDSTPGIGGAENGYYSGETPSYRTSGRPLANMTELRAIRGYDAAAIQAIAGAVCARPVRPGIAERALNINTITEANAAALAMAFSGAVEVDDARQVIRSRPTGGWPDVDTLLREPAFANVAPELRQLDRLGVVTTHMEVYAEVAYRDQMTSWLYLFETVPGRPVQTLRRERVG